jgi:hypothetical protein
MRVRFMPLQVFVELRDAEWCEHGLVEADALGVVAGVQINMVEDPKRPVPFFGRIHVGKPFHRQLELLKRSALSPRRHASLPLPAISGSQARAGMGSPRAFAARSSLR